ncbi:MAG: PilN domain-containing protein [Deltaproteobacteria bacterium]
MNLFRTVVGIDPSGKRLALSALRFGIGRPSVVVPPAVFELRADREQARMEEAGGVLLDFVTRNGLAGAEARLAIPADKVFLARVSFPPLKEKDLRPALALELDRVFPIPASRLKFNWLRGKAPGKKGAKHIIAAAPSEYIARWEETVSRAGLTLAGAVPSAWALSSARRQVAQAEVSNGALCAILRDAGGASECTLTEGAEPFFSAIRSCPPEAVGSEGFALLSEALVDAPPALPDAGVDVYAPFAWRSEWKSPKEGKEPLRPVDGFEALMADAMAGAAGGKADPSATWGALGAYGAALCEKGLDLLSPETEGAGFRSAYRAVTGALAAAALLLAISWPAAVAIRTRAEVDRLDARIASLRPAVARVEETLAILGELEGRSFVLREAGSGREEPLLILRHLTERLPQGTWLTGLRVEDRKVEIDGLSPSANEIFPLLSREGQFRNVEFASPITRQADNVERFQIRAEFVPVAAPKAGEIGGKP